MPPFRSLAVMAALFAPCVIGLGAGTVEPWAVTLVDVAEEAGLVHETIYGGLERKRFIIETNGCGVGLVDVDRDGWLDIFLCNGTRLEEGTRRDRVWPEGEAPVSRLYRNRRDGTFEDVTARAGVAKTGWASGVCVGDYDGDAWPDLFVTYYGHNVLWHNRGDGTFEDATARAGLAAARVRWGSGCAFLDYDRDGHQDLFVANYLDFRIDEALEPGQGVNCLWKGVPVNCGPRGLPTDTNLLYRNRGDGTFEDVSAPSKIAAVTGRYPMTAAAADLDRDGWIDIYVASDSTAAILYRNGGDGTFTDVAVRSGAAYSEHGNAQAGMGLALGDYNRDGILDLFKTHFADDIPALYRGLGSLQYEDVAMSSGVGAINRYVMWGAGLPDLDNDGLQDAVYVTGNVYPEVERILTQYPHRGPRIVFRNLDGERFAEVTEASGPGATARHSSRGAAFGDIDNDGDVDVVVMNMNERPSLLRNEYAGGHHWIRIRLDGRGSDAFGLGATVLVTAGGRTQARAVLSQSSYYSVDDLRVHVGLGNATRVDRIEVHWASGGTDSLTDVPADHEIVIEQSKARPAKPGRSARVDAAGH